ncbi:MAG: SnoaL-like domain-containing protein [Henriciella sp.]
MPTPQELMQLGQSLIEHCDQQKETDFQNAHYTADAISMEAVPMPSGSAEAAGLEAIKAKGEWWYSAHEVHSSAAEGPFVHGSDRFSVIFDLDVTTKETGERMQMREIGTYYVNEAGKITREEFAYAIGE